MKLTGRRKARPLLLAVASAATLSLAACGGDKPPMGNLMASPYDLSGADESVSDFGPSGNLLAPLDLASTD